MRLLIKAFNILIISIIAMGLFSCNDKNDLGLEVLPTTDLNNVVYTDTITVISSSVVSGATQADEDKTTTNLVGFYTDPTFGTSEAECVTQLNYSKGTAFNLGETGKTQIDSIVLVLAYIYDYDYPDAIDYFYGDTNSNLTINVYELEEDLYLDSSYKSNREYLKGNTPIGSLDFSPRPKTIRDIQVLKDNSFESKSALPHIRIKLNSEIATRFLDYSDKESFTTNEEFLSLFKGLYITSESAGDAIYYLGLTNTISGMVIFSNEMVEDVKTYNVDTFDINSNCVRANIFKHNYSGTNVDNHISDPLFVDNKTYIQAMNGIKTKIELPFIQNTIDSGKIIVNKAELVVPVVEDSFDETYFPSHILTLTEDSLIFSEDSFDEDNNYYKLNVTNKIQDYFSGSKEHTGWYLNDKYYFNKATRVVITNNKNASPLKLIITYTKI